MIRVETESGSVYLIDDNRKTWKRLRGEGAAEIRSDEGTFIMRTSFIVGKIFTLTCPPFNPKIPLPRVIYSTPVVMWSEVH